MYRFAHRGETASQNLSGSAQLAIPIIRALLEIDMHFAQREKRQRPFVGIIRQAFRLIYPLRKVESPHMESENC